MAMLNNEMVNPFVSAFVSEPIQGDSDTTKKTGDVAGFQATSETSFLEGPKQYPPRNIYGMQNKMIRCNTIL